MRTRARNGITSVIWKNGLAFRSLYQDPDVLKANPFMGRLEETFLNGVARPSKKTGRMYNRVSAELQTAVHGVLAGTEKAGPMLKSLAQKLEKMRAGGKW